MFLGPVCTAWKMGFHPNPSHISEYSYSRRFLMFAYTLYRVIIRFQFVIMFNLFCRNESADKTGKIKDVVKKSYLRCKGSWLQRRAKAGYISKSKLRKQNLWNNSLYNIYANAYFFSTYKTKVHRFLPTVFFFNTFQPKT